jgi:hypothetical protein
MGVYYKSRLIEGVVQMIYFDCKATHNSIVCIYHVKRVFGLG